MDGALPPPARVRSLQLGARPPQALATPGVPNSLLPKDVLISWGDGLTGLLAFMTQMALVLLLGTTLASTRPVNALLTKLSALPRRPQPMFLKPISACSPS
ncbi:MAG TPA: TIGR00366 family protein [Candidatus Corynebacterium gallistercoris]|uniref:TIGR00366 family protein n=1 Tax=Candidatus Corynebacterium gallistercoris TaxID=2838530 RepID=A0A9D1RZS1_9CORY|nr:TIGR00366 family protein [Candidatus Corynebacterium gallistercoris]